MTDLMEVAAKLEPGYSALKRAARTFDDIQHERIVISNRLRHAADAAAQAVLGALVQAEENAKRWIEQVYGAVAPSGVIAWQERTPGISAYRLGRLLGETGHPRLAVPYMQTDNPDFDPEKPQGEDNERRILHPMLPYLRTLAQWRQRCGHGAPGRLAKGASQEEVLAQGLPRAKVIVHLMMDGLGGAISFTGKADKNGNPRPLSPYRTIYDEQYAIYAERTHSGPCSGGYVSAGPGKVVFAKCKFKDGTKLVRYAEAGDPFQAGHVKAIALRHAAKAMLADLFEAAEEDWCK